MEAHLEHTRKTSLDPVRDDVAELLKSGYVLTPIEIKEICRKYGVNPGNYINLGLSAGGFSSATGINVGRRRYQRRVLFYNASLPLEDTDMERVLKEIDAQSKLRNNI